MLNDIYLDQRHAPFNTTYLQRMLGVIDNAIAQHPRTMAVRVDLRLPDDNCNRNSGLISRFIESLNAKIDARYRNKIKNGIRSYPCQLRYAWFGKWRNKREVPLPHGTFREQRHIQWTWELWRRGTGLASLIREAWLSALQLGPYPEYRTLVHIPDNPLYYLDVNNLDYKTVYDKLTFRLSYFAKERTKSYSRNERSFGCSQS